LPLGLERHGGCGFGLSLQALAFFGFALFALVLERFEPHPFFLVRKLRGHFGFPQHPLALGGFLRGAPLLLLLEAFELGLPGAVGRRTRFVHQALAFGRIGSFTPATLLVELLSLHFARAFGGDAGFLDQPFPFGSFFGFPAQAFLFVALPLGLVRALCRRFRFAQQLLSLRGTLSLEPVLLFLQADTFFLDGPFGSGLRLTRGALGSGGFFDLATAAGLLGAARFGLLGATLRLLRLLLVAGALLLGLMAKPGLFLFCGLAQAGLLCFRRLTYPRLFRLYRAPSGLFRLCGLTH
jgi:hypothetical protein